MANAPGTWDFEVGPNEGIDVTHTWAVGGVPVDVTDYAFVWEARQPDGTLLVGADSYAGTGSGTDLVGEIAGGGAAGTIRVVVDRAYLAALTAGDWDHELLAIPDGGGQPRVLLRGSMDVRRGVATEV